MIFQKKKKKKTAFHIRGECDAIVSIIVARITSLFFHVFKYSGIRAFRALAMCWGKKQIFIIGITQRGVPVLHVEHHQSVPISFRTSLFNVGIGRRASYGTCLALIYRHTHTHTKKKRKILAKIERETTCVGYSAVWALPSGQIEWVSLLVLGARHQSHSIYSRWQINRTPNNCVHIWVNAVYSELG